MVQLSAWALLIAALCWIVGDALIVGFDKPDKQKHAAFIAHMGDDMYAFYLHVNDRRLRAGALVANFSSWLLLAGLYSQWQLTAHSLTGRVGVVLLGIGFSLYPLAHAAFYPLALASERAYAAWRADQGAAAAARHARRLRAFLLTAWLPAAALAFGGWLLIGIAVATGQTAFPPWAAALTPLVQLGLWIFLSRVPYPGRPLLHGASLNIVVLVWAIAFLALAARYPVS